MVTLESSYAGCTGQALKLLSDKRIFLISQGGLGNQLFIWNAAHLALESNVKRVHIIHLSKKSKINNRQFELRSLQLNCLHSISVIQSELFNWFFRFIDSRLSNKFNLKKLIRLLDLSPDQGICLEQLQRFTFFRGYFQDSESVNQGIESWIQELQIAINRQKNEYGMWPENLNPYMAFHIRRGDYVENSSTIGTLSLKYYEQFRIEKIPLYVSSDDAEVRKTFPESIPLLTNSNHTLKGPWLDFIALSESSVLVTANSTFSWWAGILILRKGGRVIAPSPWNKVMTLSDNYLRWEGFEFANSLFESDISNES